MMILKANPMTNKCLANTPIGSMYGIFTYIWLIFMVNVGECAIYGSYGIEYRSRSSFCSTVFDVNSTYTRQRSQNFREKTRALEEEMCSSSKYPLPADTR